MAFRPEPSSEFGKLAKYVKYLRQFPIATTIRPGNFYVCVYDFDKESNPYNVIRLWDVMPLIFVYEINEPKKKMYRAINFHHVPVRPRQLWLSKVLKYVGEDFESGKRLYRIANWRILFLMMKKLSKKSVRNYYMERTHRLRQIPNESVSEVMKYYARTYYGVNISRIEKDYLVFRYNK